MPVPDQLQTFSALAREAGAKKVYFASASPPVRFPNVYGIDMPSVAELIAHGRSEKEVRQEIGADWIIYQDLQDLIDAVRHKNSTIRHFDTSCFSNDYVTSGVTREYLDNLENRRNDKVRFSGTPDEYGIDLHNAV